MKDVDRFFHWHHCGGVPLLNALCSQPTAARCTCTLQPLYLFP
jgi:hypothetical protein